MTHTPGPWDFAGGDMAVHANRLSLEICRQIGGHKEAYSNAQEEERIANAHLIAAAPELLAQLKMAADFISGHNECLSEPSGSGDREWNAYCIGLLDDCKSAIAKAEGRGE